MEKKYSEKEMNACMDVLSQFGLDTLYDYYGYGLPSISFEYIK